MRQWLDARPGDWYYNEVLEASNYLLEDGQPLIGGITYNKFDQPKVYKEFEASSGDVTFDIGVIITPSSANPLYVYVDGVQTIYKSISGSTVTLYAPPRAGARVTVMMQGIPWVDANGKPAQQSAGVYPSKALDNGTTYYWNPLDGRHLEYVYAYGKQLRRAPIPEAEWLVSDPNAIVTKYIGTATDMYAISPANHPWAKGVLYLSMNLNDVTCSIIYYSNDPDNGIVKRGGDFQCHSDSPMWNDRFFPDALLTRAEAYTMICRIRDSFYQRFTDMDAPTGNFTEHQTAYDGQRVFKLGNRYDVGASNALAVFNEATNFKYGRGSDYTEFDDHTVLFNSPLPAGTNIKFVGTHTTRFPDLNPDAWYYPLISSMELEKFGNGQPLFEGRPNPDGGANIFAPDENVTRSETLIFLNKFRKWCVERFKF